MFHKVWIHWTWLKSNKRSALRLFKDEKAQSLMIEYILILSITLLFMGGIYSSLDSIMEKSEEKITIEQYNDLGNDLSGTMNDMYLSGLGNGTATKRIKIPVEIGDEGYKIECNITDPFGRQSIKISATYLDTVAYIPLNNITQLVNVSGTTFSGSGEVTLKYNYNSSVREIKLS